MQVVERQLQSFIDCPFVLCARCEIGCEKNATLIDIGHDFEQPVDLVEVVRSALPRPPSTDPVDEAMQAELWDSLSPVQQDTLRSLESGRSIRAIAREQGTSPYRVQQTLQGIHRRSS